MKLLDSELHPWLKAECCVWQQTMAAKSSDKGNNSPPDFLSDVLVSRGFMFFLPSFLTIGFTPPNPEREI